MVGHRRIDVPVLVALVGATIAIACVPISRSRAWGITAPVTKGLTGAYQLYCPDPVETPIVLHARTTATVTPSDPPLGHEFSVSGFRTEVVFPHGVVSALHQMSPIRGSVIGTLVVTGAHPARRKIDEAFVATVPAALPGAFNLWVPSHAASFGTYTATSATALVVEAASHFTLTLTVGMGSQSQTRVLQCTAFANNTPDFEQAQPWVGTQEPPQADSIMPVLAMSR